MTELHFRTTVDACAGDRTQTYRKILYQAGRAMARGWVVEWDEYPVYKEKVLDRGPPEQVLSHYEAKVKIHVR